MRDILVVDLETTGNEPDSRVVEVAAVVVYEASRGQWELEPVRCWTAVVDPGVPIPAVASAVHHLVDADVRGGLRWEEDVAPRLAVRCAAAHFAQFERQFIRGPERWICTCRCARHLIKAPAYGLQVLRYHLGLKIPSWAGPPHRALGDALLAAVLLKHLLSLAPAEDLISMTKQPVLLPALGFGAHRGKPLSEVPQSYLQWVVRSGAGDEDSQHTARHWLGR